MRTWLIVIVIELCCAGMVQAQTANCTVTGQLFNPDGSPAAQAQVHAISVVTSGSSFTLTPIVLVTDATGFTSFTAPRLSIVWILGTALGLTASGDVAIPIPDADVATLDVLRQSAQPPVSGVNLTSGANPTLALSLQDFGINLNAGGTPPPPTVESFNGRTGAVTLTGGDISTALNFTPLDPGAVVGAVNASTAKIDDARLAPDVVRNGIPNIFSAQQTFSGGVQVNQGLTFLKPDKTVPTTPITFQTNEAGSGNFYIGMGTSPNLFGSIRRDQVLSWGYNQLPGVNDRVLMTEHALAYRMENYYQPSGVAEATETHLQYISRKGVVKRLQAWFVDLNTDVIQTNITSDASSWTTSGGMNVLITPKLVRLLVGTSLFNDTNNLQFLRQKKSGAANDYGTLIYMNNANQVALGGSGTVGLQIDSASVAPAVTGKRFLCIDTKGVITSSVTPCSGT